MATETVIHTEQMEANELISFLTMVLEEQHLVGIKQVSLVHQEGNTWEISYPTRHDILRRWHEQMGI